MSERVAWAAYYAMCAGICAALTLLALLLIDVWACWATLRTRVWWGITRKEAGEVAAFYERIVRAGGMEADKALEAYEREVGCMHISRRWAPPAQNVIDRLFAAERAFRADEFDKNFGWMGVPNVWRIRPPLT